MAQRRKLGAAARSTGSNRRSQAPQGHSCQSHSHRPRCLGCGDGGFLLEMAAHYPEVRFLGVERLLGRVRKVCNESERRGLERVRALRVESRYFLEWMIAPGSIHRLHYLFPDPWPKEKHHKNRLVQDSFIPVLHRALAKGGEVLFKTDHEESRA